MTGPSASLILGTVQLGMAYGIANRIGDPGAEQAAALLGAAMELGIRTLDTARLYGHSEERIGAWVRTTTGPKPSIISKLPGVPDGCDVAAFVRENVAGSLKALGIGRLEGYLVHRATDILKPGVAEALADQQEQGLIGAFGLSAYYSEEIDAALGIPGLKLVQAPFNLFDRRLEDSGVLQRCRAAGVIVHARSAFLQGVFTMKPESLPPFLEPVRTPLRRLNDLAAANGLTIEALALKAVAQTTGIDAVVIGAETIPQLAANMVSHRLPDLPAALLASARAIAAGMPVEVIEPSRWPKPGTGDKH